MRYFLLAACAATLCFAQTGIDPGAMDRSTNPCTDFYQYACGTWMKQNPVPADQSVWMRASVLAQRNREVLRDILEKAAAGGPERTPVEQKIGDAYASCMDEDGIEKRGMKPVAADLALVTAVHDRKSLARAVARLHNEQTPMLFGSGVGADAEGARNIVQISQGGFRLPDRDYYLSTEARFVTLREKYLAHIRKTFELAGDGAAAEREAQVVLAFETALAKASADRVTLRDPKKRNNPRSLDQVEKAAPAFDWQTYLEARGMRVRSLNVVWPDFLPGLSAAIRASSLADLKTYLRWQVLADVSQVLTKAFVAEHLEFTQRTLLGVREMPPRWRMCVQLVDNQMGEALGQKYVEQTFGVAGKQRALEMVAEIEASMTRDIQSLDWMSAATKQQALAKLHQITNKIGYPDQWRDYSSLKIVRGDLLGNTARGAEFEEHRDVLKIGQPVDKAEWRMTPPTVNAYYSPSENNINFPAGILQPPFFFRDGDEAATYGSIGHIIGHELTHGFDDQGRQYDGTGNLRDWWTAEDGKSFEQKAQCFVDEYGGFTSAGVKLNGKLTLGENAADNGGVRLAYMALQEHMAKQGLGERDGFTPEQRFFVAMGQSYCISVTDEAARQRALTDPHSPGPSRVNGVMQNMPEFQKAFGCQASDAMVAPNSCRIW
jgi:endothelin-converting enzyme/putative endopeptidase